MATRKRKVPRSILILLAPVLLLSAFALREGFGASRESAAGEQSDSVETTRPERDTDEWRVRLPSEERMGIRPENARLPGEILSIVFAHRSGLADISEKFMETDYRRLVISLRIGAKGDVKELSILPVGEPEEKFKAAVSEFIRSWSFPSSMVETFVIIPLEFFRSEEAGRAPAPIYSGI